MVQLSGMLPRTSDCTIPDPPHRMLRVLDVVAVAQKDRHIELVLEFGSSRIGGT